jgi:dipeptidyl aminopeptidase/acylaminoacyl peptidase
MRSFTLVVALLPVLGFAQPKAPAPISEWGKWESLGFAPYQLAPDGKWLAYMVQRSNGDNELRVSALARGKHQAIPFGESPAFSADSQWLAYSIGIHEDEAGKLRKDKKPIRKKLGLLKLATGEAQVFENIEAFAFSEAGAHLAMKHYAPEKSPPAQGEQSEEPSGSALTVRNLDAGTNVTFGSVSEFAWAGKSPLLAMAVNTDGKSGNAIQVLDAASASLRVLDSEQANYQGLTWRKDSIDLAVLRTKTDKDHEDETCVVLAFRDATGKTAYDPTADSSFPAGKRIMKWRAPAWSEDGATLFIGLAPWEKKQPPPEKKDDVEPAPVDVWHSADHHVIAEQKLRASRDRRSSTLAAWHIGKPAIVPLSDDPDDIIRTMKTHAILLSGKPYRESAKFGRPYHDVYRLETQTGAKTKLLEKIEWAEGFRASGGPSPTGRYFTFVRANHIWLLDVATGKQSNLTAGLQASFINNDYDHPVSQRPPYGAAGWTKDDRSVLLYDEFDVWEFFTDGAKPRRLTDGAKDQVAHRYERLDPREEFIDLERPVYFRLTGKWSKQSGYARLASRKSERLLLEDRLMDSLKKAKDAEVYAYLKQAYDDSPDFFAGGPDLATAKQVSDTNPFQSQYAWGRSELLEYRSPQGVRLQGALYYPAGYEKGKKYPMIVVIYERQSQGIHRYSPLAGGRPYNPAVFNALGYFVYLPDIVFRPRDPGHSIVECVTAAVKKALENPGIDPKRVGLTGHSWGGYGTVFTSTQSTLFAAAIAGAPLTNLSSSYGEVYWNTGIPETGHVETGQERMEVPLYEDPQSFMRNSATFFVNRMTTPLLIAHGDKDGACDLHQSIEMYNVARRAGKQLVLLVYAGENHGLQGKPVRFDYQRRAREWFGHYLKGEPAPPWITSGVAFLEREKELKRIKEARPAQPAKPPATAQ